MSSLRLLEKLNSCPIDKSTNDVCKFMQNHCDTNYFWIASKYYCENINGTLNFSLYVLAVFSSLVLIFVSLSILVAKYLYPILEECCQELNINKKFLSSLLVPFVNCFPDLVNYSVSMKSHSVELVLGQVIGQTIVLFTIIIGAICIIHPFNIAQNRHIMDELLGVLTITVTFSYILSDGVITLTECVIMIFLYMGYILYLLNRKTPSSDGYNDSIINSDLAVPTLEVTSPDGFMHSADCLSVPFDIEEALSILSYEEEYLDGIDNIENGSNSSNAANSSKISTGSLNVQEQEAHESLLIQSCDISTSGPYGSTENIYERSDRKSTNSSLVSNHSVVEKRTIKSNLIKLFQMLFNIIDFMFFFLIPYHQSIPDQIQNKRQGGLSNFFINWRHNQLQLQPYMGFVRCITIPMAIHFQLNIDILIYVVFPILLIGNFISISKYIFYVISIGMTLLITSFLSETVLQLLKNLGILLKIPESLLGLTVFALSNSVNDIITNLILANLGQPILGLNACLGTPFLSILLGIGLNGLVFICHGKKNISFDLDPNLKLTTIGVIVIIGLYVIYLPLNKWEFDRKLGVMACISWIILTSLVVW